MVDWLLYLVRWFGLVEIRDNMTAAVGVLDVCDEKEETRKGLFSALSLVISYLHRAE